MINTDSDKVRNIPLKNPAKDGRFGIAQYSTKLYCSPCNASSVLVIDGETEEMHAIPCPVQGKQNGVVLLHTDQNYSVPQNLHHVY